MKCWVFSLMVIGMALPALAEEPAITLKPGDGRDQTVNNCAACHSLDYIPMNSPFLTAEQWKAEVAKMKKVYGAPVADADAEAIAAYLAAAYGVPAGK
jgi:mono/diheme cytochrome c family protein